jgi:hypothetical protein
MEEIRKITVFLLENLKERDHLEDLDVTRKIILEWILRKEPGYLSRYSARLRAG